MNVPVSASEELRKWSIRSRFNGKITLAFMKSSV
jgi:hypothetical protein